MVFSSGFRHAASLRRHSVAPSRTGPWRPQPHRRGWSATAITDEAAGQAWAPRRRECVPRRRAWCGRSLACSVACAARFSSSHLRAPLLPPAEPQRRGEWVAPAPAVPVAAADSTAALLAVLPSVGARGNGMFRSKRIRVLATRTDWPPSCSTLSPSTCLANQATVRETTQRKGCVRTRTSSTLQRFECSLERSIIAEEFRLAHWIGFDVGQPRLSSCSELVAGLSRRDRFLNCAGTQLRPNPKVEQFTSRNGLLSYQRLYDLGLLHHGLANLLRPVQSRSKPLETIAHLCLHSARCSAVRKR